MKSHCKNGHERTPDNVTASGNCKTCRREYDKEYRVTHERKKYPRLKVKVSKPPSDRVVLLGSLVEDGWPIREMARTYGFGTRTVKKHHPEYRGQPREDVDAINKLLMRQRIAA